MAGYPCETKISSYCKKNKTFIEDCAHALEQKKAINMLVIMVLLGVFHFIQLNKSLQVKEEW